MQRFVPVGDHRIHVVAGMPHSRDDADHVAELVTALRPETVVLATDLTSWQGRNDALDAVLVPHIADADAQALWRAAGDAGNATRAQIAVLDRQAPGWPAKGIKQLERRLRAEGFEHGPTGSHDHARLINHYVAQIPELVTAIRERRTRHAARLRAAVEARPTRVVAVMALPDADAICDAIQALA